MAYTLDYTSYYYQQHPTAAKGWSGILGLIFIFIAVSIVCSGSTSFHFYFPDSTNDCSLPENRARSDIGTSNGGFWSGFFLGRASSRRFVPEHLPSKKINFFCGYSLFFALDAKDILID